MALKKINQTHNLMLIEQASIQTVIEEKKVWESELLERYIREGVARDAKKNKNKKRKNIVLIK